MVFIVLPMVRVLEEFLSKLGVTLGHSCSLQQQWLRGYVNAARPFAVDEVHRLETARIMVDS